LQDYIFNVITLIFIISIPVYFLTASFSFLFFGYRLQHYWRRILLFAVLESVYIDWFIFSLTLPVYFLNSIISYALLFLLLFHNIDIFSRIRLLAFAFVSGIFLDVLTGMIMKQFVPREDFLQEPVLLLLGTWPGYIFLAAAIYFMYKNNWTPGKKIADYVSSLKSKKILYLLIFMFIQMITVTFILTIPFQAENSSNLIYFMLYASLILGFIIIFITLRVINQTKDEAVRMTQEIYIEDINHMFTTIRGQRHDFLNHVQVMSAFIQRGKTKELEQYTRELIGEIVEVNDYIEIGDPALGALIQSKMITAYEQKIDFRYQFAGVEQLALGMKSIDIVKISANLIDNAFDEVASLPENERWIQLKCWTEKDNFCLTVQNPGRHIPKEEHNLLFSAGYSTKQDGDHAGIGLSIVKERVEYYKGTVLIESPPNEGTTFKVILPFNV
jgi:signal transduction histidine kinase